MELCISGGTNIVPKTDTTYISKLSGPWIHMIKKLSIHSHSCPNLLKIYVKNEQSVKKNLARNHHSFLHSQKTNNLYKKKPLQYSFHQYLVISYTFMVIFHAQICLLKSTLCQHLLRAFFLILRTVWYLVLNWWCYRLQNILI
jgi:hypothetical protein